MLLDNIATYLVANTTVFTVGTTSATLAKALMTDTQPDTVTVLYEQAGAGSEQAFSTGVSADVVYEEPNLQVLSRSTSYTVARNAAEKAYTTLNGLGTTTISSVRYLSIDAIQSPFSIGRDKEERYLVSCNYRVKKEIG